MNAPPAERCTNLRPGLILVAAALAVYGGLALTVDFPRAAVGIQSDEATYYMMGHSLAEDGDLAYRREDLVRVWKEFPSGRRGVSQEGRDILESGDAAAAVHLIRTQPDPDPSRYSTPNRSPTRWRGLVCARVRDQRLPGPACGPAGPCRVVQLSVSAHADECASCVSDDGRLRHGFDSPRVLRLDHAGVLQFFTRCARVLLLVVQGGGTSDRPLRGTRWLFTSAGDVAAALLLGVATFRRSRTSSCSCRFCSGWRGGAAGERSSWRAWRLDCARVGSSWPTSPSRVKWNYQGATGARTPLSFRSKTTIGIRGRQADRARRDADRHHLRPPRVLDEPEPQPW